MTSFQWPWQYEFPPFFTLQPNLSTREKQLEAWQSLVLDYCQYHKITTLDLVEAQQSALFSNAKLNRRLSSEGINAVFDQLESRSQLDKHLEWVDKSKKRCYIYWRTVDEWAKLIYDWVVSNGLLNSVCTLYELTQGEDTVGESFHGLEKDVLTKALAQLQSQGRAQMINLDDSEGVKFFQ